MRVKRKAAMILALALASTGSGAVASTSIEPAASADAVFATTLYHQLATQKGNLLFSPFSIRTALGMAYAGARGQTATQIQSVLGFTEGDQNSIEQSLGNAAKQLNATHPEYTLAVADALWGETTFPFDPAFDNKLVDAFGANLHRTNFLTGSEAARGDINRWVKKHTAGKIADLFPTGSISSSTALVLANAVYFKADWETPFRASNTHDAPFHLDATHETNVKTMHADFGGVLYTDTDALQVVELPYRGGLSMTLVVPKAIDGLAAVEKNLDAKNFRTTLAALQSQDVNLSMPKLKLNGSFSLSEALGALGMPDAFDKHRADFSGMIAADRPHPPLFIGQVFHRAVADVNEKGTEAAAATGIGMVNAMGMRAPKPAMTVNADRPFILLIRQPVTGEVLFMGRVSDPR